jgi:hypothetical protein
MDIKSYLISFIVACFSSHILVGWNLSMSWPSPTESQRHSWGMVSDRHMRIRGVILPAEMLGFVPKKKAEEGKCWTLRIVIRWLFEVHLTQKFGCHGSWDGANLRVPSMSVTPTTCNQANPAVGGHRELQLWWTSGNPTFGATTKLGLTTTW